MGEMYENENYAHDMEFGSGGPPPPGVMKDRHGPPPPHHPIKFLKTKEGTAMVQMGDGVSVERCVQNLNNVTVGEYTLTLAFSKQAYLSEVMNPYPLPDKSPSFKDYVGNKNNRFLTPASIHKNRIQPPSKIYSERHMSSGQINDDDDDDGGDGGDVGAQVLHFFNTPPDVSEEQLLQVFADYDVAPPHTISKFPLKSERSSSGLMEFTTISQSVMAIMACNHATIQHPGAKFPFVMKLCFSSSRQISQKGQQQTKSQEQNRQAQKNGLDDEY
ncbi:PREDICTED: heterogeneous nuclear ribonucleoprotein L [Papilio polytes]|uniref:heterogeneous nuclear ribonucleoprotein L n=1 Tax=Papilio polytes TaxID=76194 RepID=UPI0006767DCC|nr:PREDICTED: heterogeneous nuclear ribonucleoprotein L [Papilio polytes]